jgi:hypothetical protein
MTRFETLPRLWLWLVAVALCLFIPGCGSLTRLNAVPVEAEEQATVFALPGVLLGEWRPGGVPSSDGGGVFREQALLRAAGHQGAVPAAEFLAISGGGENGAFGRVCWSDGPLPGPGPYSRV